MFLTNTSSTLSIVTAAAGDIEVAVDWMDKVAATEPSGGNTNTPSIVTATTTVICAAPATSTLRKVKRVSIHNNHATVSNSIKLRRTDGTNVEDMIDVNLLPEESLLMNENGDWTHYDSNGADYAYVIPYVDANNGIAGAIAETINRMLCTETNTSALTSGTLRMDAVWLRRGQTVSNISYFSATTASGTPTNGFFALYDGSRNLLAQSANFTSEAWAANTIKTKAVTTPYVVPTTGLYYVGIMIAATTVPTLKGNTAKTGGQLAGTAPILHGNSTTGLTTTLPNPAAAITVGTSTVWASIT